MPREITARQPVCADIDGFKRHAAVRMQAHERNRLEQLCRVRQAVLIRAWWQWERSTGPRSSEGKARAASNAFNGAKRAATPAMCLFGVAGRSSGHALAASDRVRWRA